MPLKENATQAADRGEENRRKPVWRLGDESARKHNDTQSDSAEE
jgi:hypothetical protein